MKTLGVFFAVVVLLLCLCNMGHLFNQVSMPSHFAYITK